MIKEIFTCALLPGLIGARADIKNPYLSVNQFVIFNNITNINFLNDNPLSNRGQYFFYAEINTDEVILELLQDNKGMYFELVDNSSIYYLTNNDDNYITGNVDNWSDYFNNQTLGLNFEDMRLDFINGWIDDLNYYDLNDWLVDNDVAYFGSSSDFYIQTFDDVSSQLNRYKQVFKNFVYYYDVSISLANYTYSTYADYNFEFSSFANGSISDNGTIVSLSGNSNYSYHVNSNTLSSGNLIFNFTNLTQLDYMSQYVYDTYPFYETLQYYLNDSVDVGKLELEIESLRSANAQLQATIDSLNAGNTLPSLMWVIAGTPWESFKNIWNVNLLGLNISGFITGLITALLIVWVVKKLFK